MAYVEWLRVRGCLRWTGYVLLGLFLITAIVRIAVFGVQHNIEGWVSELQHDPASKITNTTLPGGSHRITVDNPREGVHMVIEDRGSQGRHIEIIDRSGSKLHEHGSVMNGSIDIHELPNGAGRETIVDTNARTPFSSYAVCGLVVALIVATILGAPFARENDGHLEISLTKPIKRDLLGLQTIGTDVAGLMLAFAGGVVFAVAVTLLFAIGPITFDSHDAFALGIGVLGPLAWYAMLTAATASIKRGYAAILGFAWPVAAIVVGLSLISPEGNALLRVVQGVAWVLSLVDPIAYMHVGSHAVVTVDSQRLLSYPDSYKLLMLAVLFVVYSALAIAQWRRVEA
jgi:hypothetical protein